MPSTVDLDAPRARPARGTQERRRPGTAPSRRRHRGRGDAGRSTAGALVHRRRADSTVTRRASSRGSRRLGGRLHFDEAAGRAPRRRSGVVACSAHPAVRERRPSSSRAAGRAAAESVEVRAADRGHPRAPRARHPRPRRRIGIRIGGCLRAVRAGEVRRAPSARPGRGAVHAPEPLARAVPELELPDGFGSVIPCPTKTVGAPPVVVDPVRRLGQSRVTAGRTRPARRSRRRSRSSALQPSAATASARRPRPPRAADARSRSASSASAGASAIRTSDRLDRLRRPQRRSGSRRQRSPGRAPRSSGTRRARTASSRRGRPRTPSPRRAPAGESPPRSRSERRSREEERVEVDEVPLGDHDRRRSSTGTRPSRRCRSRRRESRRRAALTNVSRCSSRGVTARPDERGQPGDSGKTPSPIASAPAAQSPNSSIRSLKDVVATYQVCERRPSAAEQRDSERRRRALPLRPSLQCVQVARQRASRSPRQALARRTQRERPAGARRAACGRRPRPGTTAAGERDRPDRVGVLPARRDQEERERRDRVCERLLDEEGRVRQRRRGGGRDCCEERVRPRDDQPGQPVGREDHGRHQQHAEQLDRRRRHRRRDRATTPARQGRRTARRLAQARRRGAPPARCRRSSAKAA